MNNNSTYNLIRGLRAINAAKDYLTLYAQSGISMNSKYKIMRYIDRLRWITDDAAHIQDVAGERVLRGDIGVVAGLADKVALLPMAKQIELESIVNFMLKPAE